MKMPYINSIKGSFIALVFFILAVIFIPGQGSSGEVELILTISTFLFAIIVGFFISRLNGRFNEMRDYVAEEDALWLSFYQMSKIFGKKFLNKVRDIIDNYYIIAFDFEIGEYYKYNAVYLHSLYDELVKVEMKGDKMINLHDDMLVTLNQIEICRNKTSELSRERLTTGQWGVLVLLAGIIIFSIFYLHTQVFFSQAIVVLFSTILIMILLLVRDLQNLRLMGTMVVVESGQEVLEALGKMRYYSYRYITDNLTVIPKKVKKYRLGMHEPGQEFKIKIVRNKSH